MRTTLAKKNKGCKRNLTSEELEALYIDLDLKSAELLRLLLKRYSKSMDGLVLFPVK